MGGTKTRQPPVRRVEERRDSSTSVPLDDLVREESEVLHEDIRGAFPDRQIGDYTIVDYLGYGEQATALLLQDKEGKRHVGKVFEGSFNLAKWQRAQRNLVRGMEISKRLNHSGLPAYNDLIELEDRRQFVVVREYVSGKSLAQLIKEKGHLSAGELIPIFDGVLDCLQYLNDESQHPEVKEVCHRDVNPRHIIVDDDRKVSLIDLDTLKEADSGATQLTSVGSKAYAHPDALIGEAHPTHDIFSLGYSMVEALLGKIPSELDKTRLRSFSSSSEPYELPNWIPENLRNVVNKTVNIENGYSSAVEIRQDLGFIDLEELVKTDLDKVQRKLEVYRKFKYVCGCSIPIATGLFAGGLLSLEFLPGIPQVIGGAIGISGGGLGTFVGILGYRENGKAIKILENKLAGIRQLTAPERKQPLEVVEPRGSIGRVYDNLLRRDTPHRRYFEALKDLKAEAKEGLPETDFEYEIEKVEWLRERAGYLVADVNFDKLRTKNLKSRKKSLDKQIEGMIAEGYTTFPTVLDEYKKLIKKTTNTAPTDVFMLNHRWELVRLKQRKFDSLDEQYKTYSSILNRELKYYNGRARGRLKTALMTARQTNYVGYNYKDNLEEARKSDYIPQEMIDLIVHMYESAAPTELPKRLEERLEDARRSAQEGKKYSDCSFLWEIEQAQLYAKAMGKEVPQHIIDEIEGIYQANKRKTVPSQIEECLKFAKQHRIEDSDDLMEKHYLEHARQYAADIGVEIKYP